MFEVFSENACVCVHPYLHLQDGGEGLCVLCNAANIKRSGENWRVVVLVLNVDDNLRCVCCDTQGQLTLMQRIYTLHHCFCLPEAKKCETPLSYARI